MKITIARKHKGLLTKTIRLGGDGKPVSDGSDCRMSKGEARVVNVAALADVAEIIERLDSSEALILGAPDGHHLRDGVVKIVAQRHLDSTPGSIARSQKFFAFREGPGLLPIDIDLKDMPQDLKAKIGAQHGGDPLAAVMSVCPALATAGRIERASTSSGIYRADTGETFKGSGGKHAYLRVLDATDIPRAVAVLADRVALAGYGWAAIGAKGQVLMRGLVDAAVGAPERLFFEADPHLEPPLKQDREARRARVIEGEAIDTKAAIPDLSPAERARLDAMRAALRREIQPEALKIRARADTADAKAVSRRTGEPFASVVERIRQRHDGRLSEDIGLAFDDPDLGERTVMDVLLDPVIFDGETLADPLEGLCYGRGKARVMLSSDGGLVVHSFAHGGALYRLCAGRETLLQVVERTDAPRVVDAVAALASDAVLTAAQKEEVLRLAAEKAQIGKRALSRSLKEAAGARDRERRRFAEAQRAFSDIRQTFEAPGQTDELEAFARKIDAVLAAQEGVDRPLRNSLGVLCALRQEGLRRAHTLGEGNNSSPPPEPVLSARIGPAAQMLVEKYIRLTKENDEGGVRCVRLPADYAAALNALDKSEIPVAESVSALPIVRNGALVSGREYDPHLRTLFCVPEEIEAALPRPEDCTLKAARQAYDFLTNEWLCDVAADADGKAVLIALALTLIQRVQLLERPCFFITAGMAGGGKTTVANMISAAVLGRRAAAMPLANNEEELRKALFSIALEGAAFCIFDNVKSGARVTSPTLEAALTSGTVKDRILGKSEAPTARCSAVFAMTGNNVEPVGDMASRSLTARINVDRADPENRAFRHPDPVGWSLEHRLAILRALYTLLLAPRPTMGGQAGSRFKGWMALVGAPIEAVSGADFNALFVEARAKDPTAEGALYAFERLQAAFGAGWFDAAAVCKLAAVSWVSRSYGDGQEAAEADALREAIEAATDRNFPPGTVSTKAMGHRLLALNGRVVEKDGWRFKLTCERRHAGNRYRIEAEEMPLDIDFEFVGDELVMVRR